MRRFLILVLVVLWCLWGAGCTPDGTRPKSEKNTVTAVPPAVAVPDAEEMPSDGTPATGNPPEATAGDDVEAVSPPQKAEEPLPGSGGGPTAELWVTRDFGAEVIYAKRLPLKDGDSVLALTERHLRVETAYGGGFINAIEGLRSGYTGSGDTKKDWLFWVNGMLSAGGAAQARLEDGDVVWWDYRDWGSGAPAPAVVGAFPRPLTVSGEVLVTYPGARSSLYPAVAAVLKPYGIKVRDGGEITDSKINNRRTPVLVIGLWDEISGTAVGGYLKRGPRSGIYCRSNGDALVALDPGGHPVSGLSGNGAILCTAGGPGDRNPLWIVTGCDVSGIQEAIASFKYPKRLRYRSGLMLQGNEVISLPERSSL